MDNPTKNDDLEIWGDPHVWHEMGFPQMGYPQSGWLMMDNPMKMDDLGETLFQETCKY